MARPAIHIRMMPVFSGIMAELVFSAMLGLFGCLICVAAFWFAGIL